MRTYISKTTNWMFNYFINSFRRKMARRYFKKYPSVISTFNLEKTGKIEFANWSNPLVLPKDITQAKVDFFKRLAPEGSMCIDIGANIGEHTVSMALAVGKSGLVLSFDPNPIVFDVLKSNSELNTHLTNIKPFNCAISETDSDYYYNSSEASFSNGGISVEKENNHGKFQLEQKIKGVNLDTFLHQNFEKELTQLRLIKVDTEGYDKEILKSIAPVISQYKPVIIAECFPKLNTEERIDLYNTIAKHGYDLYYFRDIDRIDDTLKITAADMDRWKHFDIYAIPK
jgi:FkbM family methyltransferase